MEQKLISRKIENIENELHNLRNIFIIKSKNNTISLKGISNGVKITEKEILDAKKSLFKSL